jgi:hypothetical protein
MAFKQGNNPISRKTSPMRMSPFTKQEPSMSMDELEKMSAAQDAASKAQAQQLPQIEGPGSPDYEAKTTMTYPGGEEGADYDEEGTQDGMSRKSSPANVKGSQSDHGQSSKEFADHEARVGTDGHGPSRKSSPLNDRLPKDHPHNAKGEHKRGVSRKSSPVNNVSYGTGYIGKPSAAYMNVDPAEAVMSGDEDTRQGVKRGSSYKKK